MRINIILKCISMCFYGIFRSSINNSLKARSANTLHISKTEVTDNSVNKGVIHDQQDDLPAIVFQDRNYR